MTIGYDKPLYVLPFDHRDTFSKNMFGWQGPLSPEQTAEITAAKQVIFDGFKAAVARGVPKDRAGILVGEQFGTASLLATGLFTRHAAQSLRGVCWYAIALADKNFLSAPTSRGAQTRPAQ